MRLLFVHQNLGELGGAEGHVHLTATALANSGHAVALVHGQSTGRNEDGWRRPFSDCFRLPARARVEFTASVIARFKPDALFVHNFSDLDVLRYLIHCRVPVVRMVHDHALYCMRTYKYNYFTRKICTRAASPYCVFPCLATVLRDSASPLGLRWASYADKQRELELNRECSALLVYSAYQKKELVQNGFDPAKISICAPLRAEAEPEALSLLNNRNLILFAGQIIRGKGVDALLQALRKLTLTNWECVVLGDGRQRAACERLCRKLGLSEKVTFTGYVSPPALRSYYLQASVFAVSSLWPEPFGMSGLEAMRFGLPVVAFDAGAISEWLHDGDNGYLVPWKDTALYARRLEQVLRDKDQARQMGVRAAASVRQFEADVQLPTLERVLQSVIHPGQPNSPDLSCLGKAVVGL